MRWMIPTGLFLGVLLLTGATLKDYGIAWDEPPYFHAADLHIAWILDWRNKHRMKGISIKASAMKTSKLLGAGTHTMCPTRPFHA